MNLKDYSPRALLHRFGRFLHRYHVTLFFIVVAICFGAAVLHINSMLEAAAVDETYTSPINAGSIDSETLERIKGLRTSSEVTQLEGPSTSGRLNPFGE